MQRVTFFADIIVPLPVPNLYTYRVPQEWNGTAKRGQRVIVQFGKRKYYTGIIESIHEIPPRQYEAKYIESILDEHPAVTNKQFELWKWIASYYMCSQGEVMNAALPSGLKLSSETKIIPNPAFDKNYESLNDKEYLVAEALETREVLSVQDVEEILQQKTVMTVVRSLIEKGVAMVREEVREKYKPMVTEYIRLAEGMENEENLKKIFDALEKRAHRQLELLMAWIKLSDFYARRRNEVKKADLLQSAGASISVLNELVKKNILEVYEVETGRLKLEAASQTEKGLSIHQQEAYEKIKESFLTKDTVLVHGVTSSGKTEIYVRLMAETLQAGKQVLYLLPEIALTTQIITRLKKVFGEKITVYHSRFSENERVEVWNEVLKSNRGEGSVKIILGARSSLFLPFDNLGLILVDEEHDTSFKQHDPAPRYHARDTSIYLARLHGAKTLIGSATPAIETFYNAQQGKFGYVQLTERYGGVQMPEIQVTDVKELGRKKLMKSHFSPELLGEMQKALDRKEQVILFQNRRGFAPYFECGKCDWIPQCLNCDVSLTYHKAGNQLRCHYCGYSMKPPSSCQACGDTDLKMKGFGTEKIEEELAVYFPNARIARMDLDTTRSRYAYQQIISEFEERGIDILVGTQMVTKGLDFDNVSLVGIMNADSMLHFPDFRSHERSFQLMAQVSGRAGRKSKRGLVVIQSRNGEHPIIRQVIAHDYDGMFHAEIHEREKFGYPPFYRLIELTLLHKNNSVLNEASDQLGREMKKKFGKRVLGPEIPLVSRIKNLFLKRILLKLEKQSSPGEAKKMLLEMISRIKTTEAFRQVRVQVDVDPT